LITNNPTYTTTVAIIEGVRDGWGRAVSGSFRAPRDRLPGNASGRDPLAGRTAPPAGRDGCA
jgi:hypothetical protein